MSNFIEELATRKVDKLYNEWKNKLTIQNFVEFVISSMTLEGVIVAIVTIFILTFMFIIPLNIFSIFIVVSTVTLDILFVFKIKYVVDKSLKKMIEDGK